MRRFVTFTAVFSLVLASVTAAAAFTGAPLAEVMSGNVSALWEAEDRPGNLPENDSARGLVFDGLRPGRADGSCAGGYEIEAGNATLCTHGPDPAPPGLDVRVPRSIAELTLQTLSLPTVSSPTASDGSPVGEGTIVHDHSIAAAADADGSSAAAEAMMPVIGDGTSGNRVLAVYAVASDQPDRYDEVAPLIANWAAHIDAMVNQSAALTGGERHVRFVTDASGSLVVAKVVLPPDADDSFGKTVTALKNAGYRDASRKYLMWTDANRYCGIATIYGDDKPTQDNNNNGRYPMYSRVDTGCWGLGNNVALHEVIHNMGAVQQSAPHVTPGWHCTDDYDRMCYRDASSVSMTYTCPSSMEAYLDCGHDDYFNTSPSPGSYLDSHWNVADSSFLHAGPVDDSSPPPPPPPPANEAPQVSVSGPGAVTLPDAAVLDGTVVDDGLPGPYTTLWMASGPGTVTFGDVTAEDTTVSFSAAGTYVLTLTADDSELTGDASLTIEVGGGTPPPPSNEAPQVSVSGPGAVRMPDASVLDGTVVDDGLPGPYTTLWTASGPGTVTFGDTTAQDTTVSFSAAGTYVLTLTADDSELTGDASVSITVEEAAPPPPPPDPTSTTEVFDGSLNKKWPVRTFETTTGDGPAQAVLTFGRRGKKASSLELTLNVYDASGALFATASGPNPAELSVDLVAGTYTWEVTGGRVSFSLSVTYVTP
jgi:PKD repeat protein